MPISYCSEWTTASGKIRRAYPGGVEKEVGYTYRGEKIYYNEWTRLQLHVPCHSGDETEDSADGGSDSLATAPPTPAYDWRQPKDYSQNTYSPTQSNRISPEESAARVLGSKAIGADMLQQMYKNNPVLAAMTAYNRPKQNAGTAVASMMAARDDERFGRWVAYYINENYQNLVFDTEVTEENLIELYGEGATFEETGKEITIGGTDKKTILYPNGHFLVDGLMIEKDDEAQKRKENRLSYRLMGINPEADPLKYQYFPRNLPKALQSPYLTNKNFEKFYPNQTADFLLPKLWTHFQIGGTNEFIIDASTLDFSETSQVELDIKDLFPGKLVAVNLFKSGINKNSLAFGKLNLIYVGNDRFQIVPNDFDFAYDGLGFTDRNKGTFLGGLMNGDLFDTPIYQFAIFRNLIKIGGKFKIRFIGTVHIPKNKRPK